MRREAEKQIKPAAVSIPGSDSDRYMICVTLVNVQAAEVDNFIRFDVQGVQTTRSNGEHSIMVSNPPYGARPAKVQALQVLYSQLGTRLKQYYTGWSAGVFTGDRDMPKFTRLSPKRKIPLFNGNLDCRLFLMGMVKGSNRG